MAFAKAGIFLPAKSLTGWQGSVLVPYALTISPIIRLIIGFVRGVFFSGGYGGDKWVRVKKPYIKSFSTFPAGDLRDPF